MPAVASEKEVKPAGIALPITEMTDDWMDDDTAMGSMDSEEEEEDTETEMAHEEKMMENEPKKSEETKLSSSKNPGNKLK